MVASILLQVRGDEQDQMGARFSRRARDAEDADEPVKSPRRRSSAAGISEYIESSLYAVKGNDPERRVRLIWTGLSRGTFTKVGEVRRAHSKEYGDVERLLVVDATPHGRSVFGTWAVDIVEHTLPGRASSTQCAAVSSGWHPASKWIVAKHFEEGRATHVSDSEYSVWRLLSRTDQPNASNLEMAFTVQDGHEHRAGNAHERRWQLWEKIPGDKPEFVADAFHTPPGARLEMHVRERNGIDFVTALFLALYMLELGIPLDDILAKEREVAERQDNFVNSKSNASQHLSRDVIDANIEDRRHTFA
eukprot:2675799-Prymnesium_polylepis.1